MKERFVSAARRAVRSAGTLRARSILAGALLLAATSAEAQTTPYNSLTLLWVASGDDGDQGQVSSYQLRYSTSPPAGTDTTSWWNGVPASQRLALGPPLASAGTMDSTKVTGLTPGTTYYFVLRAVDDAFNVSGYSNIAVGTTATCSAPAAAPDSFAAVADTGQVSVSWGTTTDPLAVSMHLYRAPGSSGAWTQIQNLPVGTTSYLDTSVAPGTTYRYRAAYMGTECEGPSTATATVTVPGLPPPPPASGATSLSTIHVYPNPASGPLRVVVDVRASTATAVYLRLFDLNGHWLATPVNGTYPPGTTEVPWNLVGRDGRTVGPGYYELLGTVGITRVRERVVLVP